MKTCRVDQNCENFFLQKYFKDEQDTLEDRLPFEDAPSRNLSTRLAMKPHTGKSLSEVNYVTNNITKMPCWTDLQ